jgi:hypothetical protein
MDHFEVTTIVVTLPDHNQFTSPPTPTPSKGWTLHSTSVSVYGTNHGMQGAIVYTYTRTITKEQKEQERKDATRALYRWSHLAQTADQFGPEAKIFAIVSTQELDRLGVCGPIYDDGKIVYIVGDNDHFALRAIVTDPPDAVWVRQGAQFQDRLLPPSKTKVIREPASSSSKA